VFVIIGRFIRGWIFEFKIAISFRRIISIKNLFNFMLL
jgi:hypothetical protein